MKNDNCRWNRSGLKRAQAYEFLTPRLEVNKKCQSKDFQSWLQLKIGILCLSLFAFFVMSCTTALLVRVLISSGVVLIFPIF